jgi:hypothetical protein
MLFLRNMVIPSLSLLTYSKPTLAVRPFITDDARVVGNRAAQIETWFRVDERGLQHWILPAVGFVAPLELSFGAVQGIQGGKYSLSCPIVQTKLLILETKPGKVIPGMAFITGTIGPGGTGSLKIDQWDTFGYLAFSSSLNNDDSILIHQNLGIFITSLDGSRAGHFTWGVGTQARIHDGLHFVGEVFSGDPYASNSNAAVHIGLRHFVSRILQLDATIGRGVSNDGLPLWSSFGIRVASSSNLF